MNESDSTTERLLWKVIQGQKQELIKRQKVIYEYNKICRDLRAELTAIKETMK
jgi:hypothetical protein